MNTIIILPEGLRFTIPILWFCAAYLVGSIPEAWLLARWLTGRDLRHMGSGNVGVMNTALSVARWAGLVVFLSEIAKGLLAVSIPRHAHANEISIYLSVIGVVIGVRWPIWLGFKGGRANSAGMAALPLLSYPAAAAILAFWILTRLLLNNSFKATRLTILVMPLIFGIVTRSGTLFLTILAMSWIYLRVQKPENDDHSMINQRWSSFRHFLTSPRRHHGRSL